MTESEFYHLYANVNSIAELALRELAAGGLSSAGPPVGIGEMAEFSELDFGALEGLDELVRQQAATIERFDAGESTGARPSDQEFDLATYLARAYSLEADIRARIDAHRRSPAGREIEDTAARLHGKSHGLATLLAPLSAEAMMEWLALYAEGHADLDELVIAVRKLDGV
jgi:hypothetical protein